MFASVRNVVRQRYLQLSGQSDRGIIAKEWASLWLLAAGISVAVVAAAPTLGAAVVDLLTTAIK